MDAKARLFAFEFINSLDYGALSKSGFAANEPPSLTPKYTYEALNFDMPESMQISLNISSALFLAV